MKITKGFCRLICLLLAVFFACNPLFVFAEENNDLSILNGCHTLDAANPLLGTGTLHNTESAILYEASTDTLLFACNPDQRMDPSSLAKLVTAIVAIEQADVTEIVTADELTLSTIPKDAVSANIQVEEKMPLLDLLYCMLVGSGNDAAAVVAVHMDGSIKKFAERMNAFAASVGCTNSNFTNPHGLHDEDQYTTARDIAKILSHATRNETFAKIIGSKDYVVPATNKKGERTLTTNNYLISRSVMSLYYDPRVTGGRTGVSNNGARCLAATAKQGSMHLISVVMGCKNVYGSGGSISTFGGFPETTALLDKGFQGLRAVEIFFPGQTLKQYPLANADSNLYIGVHDSFKAVLPSGVGTDDLRFVYQETGALAAPIEKNASFGTVNVYYGTNCIVSAPLFTLNKVQVLENDIIADRHEDNAKRISAGAVLAIVAAIFIAVLLLLRYSKKFRKIVGRKRRRKSRA